MIVAVIQARMGSKRLPGKVLLDLKGKPDLWHVVNRVSRAKNIDKIVVATTTLQEDLLIEDLCRKEHINVFRGSVDNVLDRFYRTISAFVEQGDNIEFIVRITADCPLIDPRIIDAVIDRMKEGNYDYVSNVIPPTYPDGLDVEVFTFRALKEAQEHARLPSEREHVTPYIINNQSLNKSNISYTSDLSSLRWTLDEPEDYELIRQIFDHLYETNPHFTMTDILHLLNSHPELQEINNKFQRNEGYRLSLENDKKQET